MIKEVDESGLFGVETRAESVSLQGATGRSEVCGRRTAGECPDLLRISIGDAAASTVLEQDERCGRWTANRCGETLATLMCWGLWLVSCLSARDWDLTLVRCDSSRDRKRVTQAYHKPVNSKKPSDMHRCAEGH